MQAQLRRLLSTVRRQLGEWRRCGPPTSAVGGLRNQSLAVLLGIATSLATAQDRALPPPVMAALDKANIPVSAMGVLVTPVDGLSPALWNHQSDVAMNPASVMKLLTTYAALDTLGPTYTWRTPVWLDGLVRQGVLKGNLVIQGQGDPKLVLERLWLLLRRVQAMGVRRIEGDIVLDRRAFKVPDADPADFDGEAMRPYSASADALLVNFKSFILTFTPNPALGVANVQLDPPLLGVKFPRTVALSKTERCSEYRRGLKADFSDHERIQLHGRYALDCGEKVWPVAYADPTSYNARALAGLWHSMGGQLGGLVRDGAAPATEPTFAMTSPPLAELIRDINKFSNNVMAQQLFYTLGLPPEPSGDNPAGTPATLERARQALQDWWRRRIKASTVPSIDNGSGLSRDTRISAQQLVQLLRSAYASPYMPELMASLPIVGLDGTLKRSQAGVASAHLKTGSLKGVMALAGYVHNASGQQLCLVAIVNHPNAAAARSALDALVDWAATQPLSVPTALPQQPDNAGITPRSKRP